MGCLKGGVVANVVVPTADYVRFASHYGFRPDFCQAADPESKGIVENLVGYAKTDLMVPQAPGGDLRAANRRLRRGAPRSTPRCTRRSAPCPRSGWSPNGNCWHRCRRCGQIGQAGDAQGRPAVVRPVRLGPLLGADPADRPSGRRCAPTTAGCWSSTPAPGRSPPSTSWSRRARRRCSMSTTAGPARAAAGAAAQDRGGEAVLRLGPVAEAFLTGAAAAGQHPAGQRARRADHPGRRPRRQPRWSPRWTGRWRSAGGAPPTCAPSWPPAPARPQPRTAGDALVLACPPCRSARWPTTRSGPCHDRRRAAAAGRRPGRRAAAAQARRDAPPRPRAADHREDPAVDARGVAAHPGRGGDHRPRRLQRPDPAQDAAFPVTKTLEEFDGTASIDPSRDPRLPGLAWNGSAPRRTCASSARPAPANATCWSRSASPRSTPGTRSATSPPQTSSRPSTAAWPTTASAASSRPCCATI